MPKRQHYGQSNDDEDLSQAPQSSKRARPADSDDEDEAPQTQTRPRRGDKGKGKGKARVNDSDDSDEEMDTHVDQAEEVGEEDEEFDRIHGPSLQRRLHKNRGKLGVRHFFDSLCMTCPLMRMILNSMCRASRNMVLSNTSR